MKIICHCGSIVVLLAICGVSAAASNSNLSTPSYQFAIYYVSDSPKDIESETQQLLSASPNSFLKVTDSPEGDVVEASYTLRVSANPAKDYGPPSVELLRYFGKGLSPDQEKAVQKSSIVQVMNFFSPKTNQLLYYQTAIRVSNDLATKYNGFIWDENTRKLHTPEHWKASRLEQWSKGLPDVSQHIAVHSYREPDGIRAVTLGMDKFGLPDLVIDPVSTVSGNRSINLMNIVAQRLLSGQWPKKNNTFTLKLGHIQHPAVKASAQVLMEYGAKKHAKLKMLPASFEDGDNPNRQFRIVGMPDDVDDIQRLTAAIDQFYGYSSRVEFIDHNKRLMAASAEAKAKLPALRARFQKGLKVNERLTVKGPFATDSGGTEWMWLEVTAWPEGRIEGILMNQPRDIAKLARGGRVTVTQNDVFDYTLTNQDGSEEGNETTRIILEMQDG